MKKYAILLLSLMGVIFSSCNDGDLDMWETIELEATCPIHNQSISYKDTTTNIDIKTNGKWYVMLPDWMHTNQAAGKGNANIVINIDTNEKNNKSRSGQITVVADNSIPEDNIVGSTKTVFNIQQESGFGQVTINFSYNCVGRRTWKNSDKYHDYYKCSGEYSYSIISDLNDDELKDFLSNLNISLKATYDNTRYWDLTDLPTTKGQHKGVFPEKEFYASAIISGPDEIGTYSRKFITYNISYELKGLGEQNIKKDRSSYWNLQ